jgi:hypothetical protein
MTPGQRQLRKVANLLVVAVEGTENGGEFSSHLAGLADKEVGAAMTELRPVLRAGISSFKTYGDAKKGSTL